MQVLLSLYTWLEIVVCFILFFPFQLIIFLLTVLFDKHKIVMHYHSAFCAKMGLLLSPLWKIKINGLENIDKKKTYVIIMNHQSLLDVLLAYQLGIPMKMTAKLELGFVPIVGWNMVMSNYIIINRKSKKSQIKSVEKMENFLRNGDSLMIFPEGTRTKDGELGIFKKGAFRSAIATETDILPVVVDGPYQLLPKKGFVVKLRREMILSVLPSVSVSKNDKVPELTEKCKTIIANELTKIRETDYSL